jgi:hypothetical protein
MLVWRTLIKTGMTWAEECWFVYRIYIVEAAIWRSLSIATILGRTPELH